MIFTRATLGQCGWSRERRAVRPGRLVDNSPAIYRWVGGFSIPSVPEGRSKRGWPISAVPTGLGRQKKPQILAPAVNCWAIVIRPSGTESGPIFDLENAHHKAHDGRHAQTAKTKEESVKGAESLLGTVGRERYGVRGTEGGSGSPLRRLLSNMRQFRGPRRPPFRLCSKGRDAAAMNGNSREQNRGEKPADGQAGYGVIRTSIWSRTTPGSGVQMLTVCRPGLPVSNGKRRVILLERMADLRTPN